MHEVAELARGEGEGDIESGEEWGTIVSLVRFFGSSHFNISFLLGAISTVSLFLVGRGEQARRGQGGLPRAAGGLCEIAADGERERTVYSIAMIRQGRMRSMNHHHHVLFVARISAQTE